MLRVALALWFGVLATAPLNSQPLPLAAAQLAARTSSLLPRHPTVLLEFQNLSTLQATEWSEFQSQLQSELRKSGVELAAGASSDPRIRITLAESARGLLFVAEVASGESRQIAMLPWNPPPAAEDKPRVTLTKKLLWSQPEPILDVLLPDPNSMLLLTPSKVASLHLTGTAWLPGATASLVLPRPMPRDPRGRLESNGSGFVAYLPGATCTGTLEPDLKVSCAAGNEIWKDAPVRWVTDRNLLESDPGKGPFYTSASGVTGAEGWGSDIAPIQSACGSAILATSAATDRDSVQAYQNNSPVSDALPLPGPVTALWPAETRDQASLVVHNLQTGEYEASRLGLACSQ